MSSAPSTSNLRLRWLAAGILLLSLVVHLTLLEYLKGELILPAFEGDTDQVINITLQAPAPIKPAPRATVRQPPPVATAPAEPPPAVSTPTAGAVAKESASVANNTTAAMQEEINPQQDAVVLANPEPESEPQTPLFERASLPPPAELGYTVTAVKEGRKIEGHGSILWQPSPTQYVISGEVGVLFFSLLSYKSTGSVDTLGIAPELYVEKRMRKPETNTHFHRERKQITFSASTNAFPSTGGEQDQASVIWQLASFGRGDGGKFTPGLAFDIFVAGTRSASDWRVYVNGKETINVTGSNTEAWHLTLTPTGRSYEHQFEVWLAPQKEWYPVRLRYANNSDGYIEMLLTKLNMHN